LSETLVMMIVAGIVFVAVMDGVTLFNRYAGRKTRQIADNMRLWEGYYHLRDLSAAADSVSAEDGLIRLFRDGALTVELIEADASLVARFGSRTDTLMSGIFALRLAADTVRLTLRDTMTISFSVTPPSHKLAVKNLEELETPYAYDTDQ
jgi:hypothetical protein